MWGALAYSSTLFPPPSRRLANYNFFTWTLAYNLTLLAGALREGYKNLFTESVPKGGTPAGVSGKGFLAPGNGKGN